jgi:hypothetical protein
MIVVHTKTEKEYERLMELYEKKGWKWLSGEEPTDFKIWFYYKKQTGIIFSDKFQYGRISYYKEKYKDIEILSISEAELRLKDRQLPKPEELTI